MSDTNAVTEPLTPRTARERALCRQACVESTTCFINSSDSATVASFREHALAWASQRYPDPPRELRKVTWLNWSATYTYGAYTVRGGLSPMSFFCATAITRDIVGVTDDILRELLALPADPYLPEAEPADPRKLGYAVMRTDGTRSTYPSGGYYGLDRVALAHARVDARNRPDDSKLHVLLLGDEVPADG